MPKNGFQYFFELIRKKLKEKAQYLNFYHQRR